MDSWLNCFNCSAAGGAGASNGLVGRAVSPARVRAWEFDVEVGSVKKLNSAASVSVMLSRRRADA